MSDNFQQGPNFQQNEGGTPFGNGQQQAKKPKQPVKISAGGISIIILLIVGIFVLANSVYFVREDEVAIVRQFGKISHIIVDNDNTLAEEQTAANPQFSDIKVVRSKGLFFKIPFITQVDKESSKLITYVSNPAEINTQDKIKYEIRMFAQWEITHPALFSTSLGTIGRANSKIDEVVYADVIQRINSVSSSTFLTDKESLNEVLILAVDDLNVALGRQGIQLRDIEVYRTILPPSNIQSTYNKMIAEREAIAQQIRSEGLELFNNTVADTDKQVAEIKASAIEEAESVRGDADAQALEIYADGFNRDPEFYEFWRTLQTYENTLDEDTVIFMNGDNPFLDVFNRNK